MILGRKLVNNKLRVFLFVLTVIILSFITFGRVDAIPNETSGNNGTWMGAWAASPQPAYGQISENGFDNQTIRMVVNPKASGTNVRIRFSNSFGEQPLTLGKVEIALEDEGAKTVEDSGQVVTFGGESTITIPPGAEVFSDAIAFPVTDGKNVTISVYVPEPTGKTTWHTLSNQTTYISTRGDHTDATDAEAFTTSTTGWFWLTGMDVLNNSNKKTRVVVTLGDSITDGLLSTLNANHRWPDFLNDRLDNEIKNQHFSVLNAGISGNKILRDAPNFGVNALARLNRDVLSQTGVTDVILLQGINDIGHQPHTLDAEEIIAGMKQIANQVQARGLNIYVGTLTPFRGYKDGIYFTEEGEKTRKKVNEWIRNNNVFDGYIDFDLAMADPSNPERILPAYDSGDHLHFNDAGYKAMAEAIDLSIFRVPESR